MFFSFSLSCPIIFHRLARGWGPPRLFSEFIVARLAPSHSKCCNLSGLSRILPRVLFFVMCEKRGWILTIMDCACWWMETTTFLGFLFEGWVGLGVPKMYFFFQNQGNHHLQINGHSIHFCNSFSYFYNNNKAILFPIFINIFSVKKICI